MNTLRDIGEDAQSGRSHLPMKIRDVGLTRDDEVTNPLLPPMRIFGMPATG